MSEISEKIYTLRMQAHMTQADFAERMDVSRQTVSKWELGVALPEMDKLGLTPCFDGIVLSSDAGVKKPDPAIFEHILSKYGLRPEHCVMIGNDRDADMCGAANLGIAGRYIHTDLSPERWGSLPPGCREITGLLDLIAPLGE